MPLRYDTESFIAEVINRYPENADKFDYSKSVYTGASNEWKYSCNVCGYENSLLRASDHLIGKGCLKCKLRNRPKGVEAFKEKFEKLYEGKDFIIDYADYMRHTDKISVICPIHGRWVTTPANLVSGSMLKYKGCPKCNRSNGGILNITLAERHKETYLKQETGIYLLKLESKDISCYKLGLTQDLHKRLGDVRRESSANIEVLFYEKLDKYNAIIEEQTLLQNRGGLQYHSPVKFAGSNELLTLSDEQASDFIEYLDSMVRRVKQT